MEKQFTKGIWKHSRYAEGNVVSANNGNDRLVANCMRYSNNMDNGKHILENISNAELVIDAGNTANKTGLFPSEILEQRDELLKACLAIRKTIGAFIDIKNLPQQDIERITMLREAIKKATNESK